MSDKKDYKCFLIIEKQKILFKIFDPINGPSLIKELSVENSSIDHVFYFLEIFLKKKYF